MSRKSLPQLRTPLARDGIRFDVPAAARERWNAGIRAQEDDATITIYDVIGETWDGGGVTANRISSALRRIGARDVTVNINSPGGDVFEGIAIYNLLRLHPHNVTVRVVGLAASAASVIAMAGDDVQIGGAAFLMIHNVWAFAIGNRNDMRKLADDLEPIDAAIARVYAMRTGMEQKKLVKMMDDETWIGGEDAVASGFADALLPDEKIRTSADAAASARAQSVTRQALADRGAETVATYPVDVVNEIRALLEASAPAPEQPGTRLAADRSSTPAKENGMTQKQTDPAASTPAAGPETPKHTDAQLDAARNEARADGHQAGRAEGEKEGRKAERTRLAAILAHAEAKDRQPLALSIATETDMDVDQAGKVLAAAPKQAQPNALAAVMAGIQNPNVGTDPSADIESEERLARVIAGVKPEASAAH